MPDLPSPVFDPSIRIKTADGSVFRCIRVSFPRAPGAGVMSERRWVFTDANGRDHVGPFALVDQDADALQTIVEEWWTAKRAQGSTR